MEIAIRDDEYVSDITLENIFYLICSQLNDYNLDIPCTNELKQKIEGRH